LRRFNRAVTVLLSLHHNRPQRWISHDGTLVVWFLMRRLVVTDQLAVFLQLLLFVGSRVQGDLQGRFRTLR
jgi:hypothetical protein